MWLNLFNFFNLMTQAVKLLAVYAVAIETLIQQPIS